MSRKVVIVGGGIAGLTLAERLTASERDIDVTVLERENSPGGLARTFSREGFLFDIGPHRFHTSDPLVSDYLLDILGDDHVTISRSSNVYMAGKYRSWPLSLRSVAGLPLPVLFRSFLDIFRYDVSDELRTFADHVISKYGRNIYDYFFRDYTEKFTGCRADELHLDWAEAGVNRAVIDKNVKADDLMSLLKGLLIPKPVSTRFYYTSTGGIQTFCDRQAKRITKSGGALICGCTVTGLEMKLGRVTGVRTRGMGTFESDQVYWSAPVSLLFPDAGFRFMDTLVCNIALSREQQNDYQWCYFGQKEILFSRLTVPRNFRKDTVPEGCDSLIAEITIDSKEMRSRPESLKNRLFSDLASVDALRLEDVIFADWKVIPETYPLYDLEYRDRLDGLGVPSGLTLLGRCGSFWYNNMDHSIGQALAMAEGREFEKDFWKD
ncbi:MAG: FAD-dependent oxidoreductase [Candidatus Fermentibacteraceae bacterium]|nr:FAD-dependent oxidoreductase [Candidatus Fermentibacteraceae bacterium]MBN2607811.1 FAD-dependent oxidoreductase [Candidatus Fermentibacteraceae bacterium]